MSNTTIKNVYVTIPDPGKYRLIVNSAYKAPEAVDVYHSGGFHTLKSPTAIPCHLCESKRMDALKKRPTDTINVKHQSPSFNTSGHVSHVNLTPIQDINSVSASTSPTIAYHPNAHTIKLKALTKDNSGINNNSILQSLSLSNR